jgi:hypothetical protein
MVMEKATGRGYVSRQGSVLLGNVPYDLRITRDLMKIAEGHVAAPGPRRVEGRIDVPAADLFMLMESDVPHTLVLEDGRTLNFFVVNSTGRIARAKGGSL